METDEAPSDAAPPSTNETDVNMQDAKATADALDAENGVPESGDKPVQMETDTKVSNLLLPSYVGSPSVICWLIMSYLLFLLDFSFWAGRQMALYIVWTKKDEGFNVL